MTTRQKLPLLVLLGPTAAGKTELSLRLAEELGTDIISGDSMLLYRGFDIGSAKPTKEELMRVRHHLVDVLDADESFAVQWSALPSGEEMCVCMRSLHSVIPVRRSACT